MALGLFIRNVILALHFHFSFISFSFFLISFLIFFVSFFVLCRIILGRKLVASSWGDRWLYLKVICPSVCCEWWKPSFLITIGTVSCLLVSAIWKKRLFRIFSLKLQYFFDYLSVWSCYFVLQYFPGWGGGQCYGSGLDPGPMGSLDPNPDLNPEVGGQKWLKK
jgi:hypothetical protein